MVLRNTLNSKLSTLTYFPSVTALIKEVLSPTSEKKNPPKPEITAITIAAANIESNVFPIADQVLFSSKNCLYAQIIYTILMMEDIMD